MADDFLPFEALLYAVLPIPAWPESMDPAYDPTAVAESFDPTRPVIAHFRFLQSLGFELAPPDAWERGTTLAIPYVRDDVVVLIVVAEMSGLFVLVTPTLEGDVTARRVLRAASHQRDETSGSATFGSFPVPACSAERLDRLVARHAGAFNNAVGSLLQERPANIPRIAAEAATAVHEASRTLQMDYYRRRAEAAITEGRDGGIVESYERLSRLVTLNDEEARRLAGAKARLAQRPGALDRGEDSEREWLERRAAHLREKGRALDEAFDHRSSAAGYSAWEDAAREYREALEIMYPPEFWDDVRRLQEGDRDAIEPALTFLEVDPWCFRSGYAKETILRLLRRHQLSTQQQERLEAVLLRAVDIGDRREFRSSCKLARKNATQRLREGLHARLHSDDQGVARRALWMLTAIRRPQLNEAEVAIAQDIILEAASGADDEFRTIPDWVGDIAWRYWSDEWEHALLNAATAGGPKGEAALRVLSRVPRVNLDAASRDRLSALLLGVVEHGGDESWFERMAPWLDSPGLRVALEERREHPDSDVRRRAWWALNAMLRAEARRADP